MRNIFLELNHSPEEIKLKLEKSFHSLFEGNSENERLYFETNEGLAYIVDIGHNDIRSEGMSYGMLITALMQKKEFFDKLWNFSKRYLLNHEGEWKGYFSWQVSTHDFSMIDKGAAPDGEEYFAAALLLASKIFNDEKYKEEGLQILNAMAYKKPEGIVHTMMDKNTGLVRFSPAEGNDFTDPSYHTLAFYRLFAKESGDSFWENAYKKSLEYLKKALHPVTGLPADYSEFDGSPKKTSWHSLSHCFSGDAWRVIWNISLDYEAFSHDAWEGESVLKMLSFFESQRPYFSDYEVDGSKASENARTATTGHIAMNATGTLTLPENHPYIKIFAEDLWNTEAPTGAWRYYDGMLYMIALLACSGKFSWINL